MEQSPVTISDVHVSYMFNLSFLFNHLNLSHYIRHPITNQDTLLSWVDVTGCVAGLRELTLSANPGISAKGWARLAIAVAHSSQLRVLNLDYNPLGTCLLFTYIVLGPFQVLNVLAPSAGDQIAGMLAVAVASSRTLEVLDLEGTGLTNHSAQVDLSLQCSSGRGGLCPSGWFYTSWATAVVASSVQGDRCSDVSCAGFPGHGRELPNQSACSGSGREFHQSRAAAADLWPAVRRRGGWQRCPTPEVWSRFQQGTAASQI